MTCKLCQEYREKYPLQDDEGEQVHVLERHEDGTPSMTSSPILCAFEDSNTFSTDNWSCETMGLLRNEAKNSRTWHEDSSLGVIRIPLSVKNVVQQGILVLSWYKSRGRTGRAVVFRDDSEPETLTLETALLIIENLTYQPDK